VSAVHFWLIVDEIPWLVAVVTIGLPNPFTAPSIALTQTRTSVSAAGLAADF
jgi:hypothetical protein